MAPMGDIVGCGLATERDASTGPESPPVGSRRRPERVVAFEHQPIATVLTERGSAQGARGWRVKTHDVSSGWFSEEASGCAVGGQVHPPEGGDPPKWEANDGCGSVSGSCPRPAQQETEAHDGGDHDEEHFHDQSFSAVDVTASSRPRRDVSPQHTPETNNMQ
jgi:hypothetical protein